MWAMITKEFRELRRDRRTVAMMIVLPVVLLVVFGYAANFKVSDIPAVVVGPGAQPGGRPAARADVPRHRGRSRGGRVRRPGAAAGRQGGRRGGDRRQQPARPDGRDAAVLRGDGGRRPGQDRVSGGDAIAPGQDPLQPGPDDLVGDGPRPGGPDPGLHRHADHQPRRGPGAAGGHAGTARGDAVPRLGRHRGQDRAVPDRGRGRPRAHRRHRHGRLPRAVCRQRRHLRPRGRAVPAGDPGHGGPGLDGVRRTRARPSSWRS